MHCPNLGNKEKEELGAAKGEMEKNGGERKTEDGSCHMDRGCQRCERQSRVINTGRWPILSEERGH